jgi:hypothetical protein
MNKKLAPQTAERINKLAMSEGFNEVLLEDC